MNDSLNPDSGVVFATLLIVTVSWNPDGGVVLATLSMVTVSLNPDGGVVFITLLLNLSIVTAFISPDGGVVFALCFTAKRYVVRSLPPVCERFLKAVVNNRYMDIVLNNAIGSNAEIASLQG